eukprot:COSAG01_NODE_3000_length_6737_cov_23.402079_2_plen_538_part_00
MDNVQESELVRAADLKPPLPSTMHWLLKHFVNVQGWKLYQQAKIINELELSMRKGQLADENTFPPWLHVLRARDKSARQQWSGHVHAITARIEDSERRMDRRSTDMEERIMEQLKGLQRTIDRLMTNIVRDQHDQPQLGASEVPAPEPEPEPVEGSLAPPDWREASKYLWHPWHRASESQVGESVMEIHDGKLICHHGFPPAWTDEVESDPQLPTSKPGKEAHEMIRYYHEWHPKSQDERVPLSEFCKWYPRHSLDSKCNPLVQWYLAEDETSWQRWIDSSRRKNPEFKFPLRLDDVFPPCEVPVEPEPEPEPELLLPEGAVLLTLTPKLGDSPPGSRFGISIASNLRITKVTAQSAAERAGVLVGATILSINGKATDSKASVVHVLKTKPKSVKLALMPPAPVPAVTELPAGSNLPGEEEEEEQREPKSLGKPKGGGVGAEPEPKPEPTTPARARARARTTRKDMITEEGIQWRVVETRVVERDKCTQMQEALGLKREKRGWANAPWDAGAYFRGKRRGVSDVFLAEQLAGSSGEV